ncbi:MAG: FecR family protein [Opitutales bacterium]|nr:FecR family protein [Opitutales bacterium]
MMNTYRIPNLIFQFIFFCLLLPAQGQDLKEEQPNLNKGAVIVVAVEGKVAIVEPEGTNKEVKLGGVLAEGDALEVDSSSQATLLLSNGTILTVVENTKLTIGLFNQEPFDAGDKDVATLEQEPSPSQVEIDLDFGSLIVKTKKLSRNSSFDINSPVGTAGIRGTEFQLGVEPGKGMKLDVTESTVAFTPPGGSPTPVSQGQGLDVSSTGSLSSRPVNPAAAQTITTTNKSASQVSGKVKLASVSKAMTKSTAKSKERREASSQSRKSRNAEQESSQEQESEAGSESKPETKAPNNEKTQEPQIDEILESDPDAKQTRKTGKKSGASASQLVKFDFDEADLSKFYTFSESVQAAMVKESPSVVRRLLSMASFSPSLAEVFFGYSKQARVKVLVLEDSMFTSLLDSRMEEAIVLDILSARSVSGSGTEKIPDEITLSDMNNQVLALGDKLRESGNLEVYERVEEMNGGEWSKEWVSIAEVGNQISQDYNLVADWSRIQAMSAGEALDNPFYDDVSSLYNQLLLDSFDAGNDPLVFGGRSLSLGSQSYNFKELLGDKIGLLMGATESLSLDGVISFTAGESNGVRLIAASGGTIEVAKGTSVKSTLSDLVIAAREDVLLQDVNLETVREVALRSLRDLNLNQVTINAPDRVHLRASRNLDVDGLQLSQSLPSLIMDATTIRLSNVDFPSATAVQLNSLKGPINGRYPNFGTGVSLEQQLGRVNFIENVRSGGNLMNDRPTFDQFGGNISIGKLANP